MEHRPINKKLAIIFIIVMNFFCLEGLWGGYSNIRDLMIAVNSQIDMVRFSSREGFFIFSMAFPIFCLYLPIEKFWPDFVKNHKGLLNKSVIVVLIAFFASGFIGSSWIKAHVENAGYTYCHNASGISALSRTLVYTKNMDICEKLVETKRKR
jgi:hypothetical protein